MIKKDAAIMQDLFQLQEVVVAAERRADLARKGRALYGKYCGTDGKGICAESFAEYHIWRGEYVIAYDFLEYLDEQLNILRQEWSADTHTTPQIEMTEQLIARIRALLGEEVPST